MKLPEFEDFELVPARPEHHNYVLSTWVKSALERVDRFQIPRALMAAGLHDTATANLDRVYVLISAGSEGHNAHGWISGRRGAAYWMYLPHKVRLAAPGLERAMALAVCGPAKEAA